MSFKKLVIKVALYWLVWRAVLFLAAAIAPAILSYQPTFPYAERLAAGNLPAFLYSWANFDGVHYLEIAKHGYLQTDLIQAFFPIFPLLMRVLQLVVNDFILSGLLLSNAALIGVMYFGYKLCSQWFNSAAADHFLLVLLTFPTAFYLGAVYTESLFLLLILAGCWYYGLKKNLISGLLIGLSSGVRLAGVMLLPSYFSSGCKKLILKSGL